MHPLFFHKLLPSLVLPPGLTLLLLLAAIRWRSRALAGVALALLWLCGTPVVADAIMRSLEDQYPYRTAEQCPVADAVFPLGGGIVGRRDHGGKDAQWNAAAERFGRAVELFTRRRASVLVLSRGWSTSETDYSEGARLKEIAVNEGVPEQSIIVTGKTINTAEESAALCGLAARMRWKRVLLVTSAFHMPRAMRLFRGCPAEIVAVPVDYSTPEANGWTGNGDFDRFLPQAEALYHSERALREYLGMAFYAILRRS